MDDIPRFSPSSTKAVEVILWLANACPRIDVYHLAKACYFADKQHLNLFGRPIAGDNYDAAPYGPLAQVVYGLLKHDPIDLLALGGNGDVPFRIGPRFEVISDREPNRRKLSASDVEALEYGLRHVRNRSFDDIYAETHADEAYLKASTGRIDPRDLLSADLPDRAEKAEDIRQSAEYMAF